MQPSNQLKGLVESYNSVYANRQELEEAKVIAETVINSVGVYMVEQGYTESDVKEFFKTSSIAKIDDVVEEALNCEAVQNNLNENVLFETHLRYIPGAMATRMKNESPEIVSQLTQQIAEFINLRGGKTGERIGRGIRRIGSNVFKGAVDVAGAGLQGLAGNKTTSKNPLSRAQNAFGRAVTLPARTTAGVLGGVARGLTGTGSKSTKKPSYKGPGGNPSGSGEGQAQQKSGSSSGGSGTSAKPKSRIDTTITKAKPAAAAKPTLSAKDTASNAEYDRLRKSDPAAAKKFGMAASKAKFGSNKPQTKNPLMQRTFGYQKGNAPDQVAKKAKMKESAELDLVLQHLVSEGIAESLQGALVMVEGMSDQFINSIIEQAQMGSAMVEFLIQNGEAESIEEAQYIISELDEENIDLLIQSITEGGMTLLGGKRGYVRYGGPEKKGDQKVSGIGPFGTYARKSEGSTGGTKTKSQTMKMTSDGKPRKY